MAITDKEQGVWILDEVYNKQMEGGIWSYTDTANLYTWGRNEHGQLGLNQATSVAISSPTQVPGSWSTNEGMTLSGRKVSARDFVLNIKSDGTLWTWGSNSKGQLAQNNRTNYSSPIQIGTDTTWAAVGDFTHYAVSSATKTDGTLWFWGDGDSKHQIGAVVDRSSPTQVPGTTWNSSFTSSNHSGAFTSSGELWLWGTNSQGQLGQNNTTDSNDPVQVGTDTTWLSGVGGDACNFAVKTDGTLWAWGFNDYGQLGLPGGEPTRRSSPTQLTGTTWTEKISANSGATFAVKTDGTLWTWGVNHAGQLGHNDRTDQSSPVQVNGTTWDKVALGNYNQAFAIKNDGSMWSWGNTRYGSLGQNSGGPTPGNSGISSPTQVPGTWATVIGAGTDNGGVALKL